MTILAFLLLCLLIYLGILYWKLKKAIQILQENIEFQNKFPSRSIPPLNDQGSIHKIYEKMDQLCQENLQLKHERDELSKEYRELMSNISHDLRTPLTAMLGYLDLLKDQSSQNEKYLNIIKGKANYLKNLIEKFYELSLTVEGKDIKSEYFNIKELMMERIFLYYDQIQEKGQNLTIDIPEDFNIYSSKEGILSITTNALDNMLKYSKGDHWVQVTKDPLEIIFSNVTDLPDGNYDDLFERTKVLDSSRKNASGIGLSIIKANGDNLSMDSHIDVKDYVFTLRLTERGI
ncbi:MAG: HAMP domain-containing sensor histidine kinase [Tissierellia bacterium]|nr:HAMP domain-containing sensor histidine kinase [Tissierellia bacterium]